MHGPDYLDVLAFSGNCAVKGHPGFGRPVADCEHPECVVRTVLET